MAGDGGFDREQVVVAGRFMVFAIDLGNHEDRIFFVQARLRKPEFAHEFGAAALHVAQVVRIVDDITAVGVFVVDADGEAVDGEGHEGGSIR